MCSFSSVLCCGERPIHIGKRVLHSIRRPFSASTNVVCCNFAMRVCFCAGLLGWCDTGDPAARSHSFQISRFVEICFFFFFLRRGANARDQL